MTERIKAAKGFKFYLEYPNRTEKNKASIRAGRLGNHMGTVVALYDPHVLSNYDAETRRMVIHNPEAYVAVHPWENSGVNWGQVSWGYLSDNCIRISAELARRIHPSLFARLEADAEREKEYSNANR